VARSMTAYQSSWGMSVAFGAFIPPGYDTF
jgi:hypothetical protein